MGGIRTVGIVFLGLFSVVLGAPVDRAVVAGSKLPDTHAGRCAKAFVEAFNANGLEKMRAFEEAHRAKSALVQKPMEERLKQAEQLRSDWGRIEPRAVVASEERAITVLMYSTLKEEHFEYEFAFEEAAPFGLLYIKIQGPVSIDSDNTPTQPLSGDWQKTTLEGIAKKLEANYVFPEVGAKMAAMLREKAASSDYAKVERPVEFARRVTDDLRAVCNDKHLTVRPGALLSGHGGGPMRRPGGPDEARRDNYGFRQVELLPGNIGYLRFDEFNPSEEAKKVAAGAMAFLSGCDAMIYDLRQNGGGSPEMIRFLSSYLFDKPTHLNSFYDRSSNKTEEFWTEESVVGKRFGQDLPVYVLTSHYTFSGAEEFSYNLLNLKRATLVGETTGGGAHPVQPFAINEHFSIMVPFARAVNPITKTNWEGVGVKPHLEVEASAALDKAKELARTEIEKRRGIEPKP